LFDPTPIMTDTPAPAETAAEPRRRCAATRRRAWPKSADAATHRPDALRDWEKNGPLHRF